MGYESKLYFCFKYPNGFVDPDIKKQFVEKIVEVNMCKIGGVPSCFVKSRTIDDKTGRDIIQYKETDCFVYADDGDTRILEDCYGDPLYECTIPELYQWLEEQMAEDSEGYRRYDLLLNVIKGFCDIKEFTYGKYCELKPKWQNMIVLHFGY